MSEAQRIFARVGFFTLKVVCKSLNEFNF